ncbi:MAG: hypothetical protein WA326_06240 [Nitrososphaeraceae archaeon]
MSNKERKQVNTILSDYDGTLYPTIAVRDGISNGILFIEDHT